jgi:predicted permease
VETTTQRTLAEWRREWRRVTRLTTPELDELAAHLLDSIQRFREEGLSEDDAIARAIEQLGPPLDVAEEYAKSRPDPGRWEQALSFFYDLRHALRQVRCHPFFTLVAVGSVGVAVAFNALAFSIVSGLLLEDPGFGRSERLVEVYTATIDDPRSQSVASWPIADDLRGFTDLFDGVVGYEPLLGRMLVEGNHVPVFGEVVGGDFFEVLDVPAASGRGFTKEDARVRAPVAVLSHDTWQAVWAGRSDVLGASIQVNGEALTIVGVAPEDFHGAIPAFKSQVWLPRWVLPLGRTDEGVAPDEDRDRWLAQLKARLAPGVSAADAEVALRARAADLAAAYPESYADVRFRVIPTDDVTLSPAMDGVAFSLAGAVMAVVALVLLIASVNLAGFLLARGADRWVELQLRYALGATRTRIVGQLFTESLIVSVLGGLLGLLLCFAGLDALTRVDLPIPVPLDFDFSIDATVVLYTIGLSVAAAAVFGLVPAVQATHRGGGRGAAGSATGRVAGSGRIRRILLAGQVAGSLVFLVLGGLFTRSLLAEAGTDPGFRTTGAAVMTLELASAGYSREGLPTFLEQLRSSAEEHAALSSIAFTSRVPMGSVTSRAEVSLPDEGRSTDEPRSVETFSVGSSYFDAMGVRIVEGRGVLSSDRADTPPVVVVSRSFIERYAGAGASVGAQIDVDGSAAEIVGVAEDVRVVRPRDGATPHLYRPLLQEGAFLLSVVGLTTAESGDALRALRATVEAVDPTVAVWSASTIEEHVALKLIGARIAAGLLVAASVISLVLTLVGVFGSVSYSASRRSYEMAIRLSLGATPGSVTRIVVVSMLRAIAVGAVVGLGLSVAGTGFLRGLLYGVGPFDARAYLFAVALLGGAAALAAYLPARGAGRSDLTAVLKDT